MVVPAVVPRMKEGNDLPGLRILRFDAVGLAEIAPWTCPGKVFESRITTQRLRHNMFDMESGPLECLVHAAVFAPFRSALGDLPLDFVSR